MKMVLSTKLVREILEIVLLTSELVNVSDFAPFLDTSPSITYGPIFFISKPSFQIPLFGHFRKKITD